MSSAHRHSPAFWESQNCAISGPWPFPRPVADVVREWNRSLERVDVILQWADGERLKIERAVVRWDAAQVPVGAKVFILEINEKGGPDHDKGELYQGTDLPESPPRTPDEWRGGPRGGGAEDRGRRAMSEEAEVFSEFESTLRSWKSSGDLPGLAHGQPSFGEAMAGIDHSDDYAFGTNYTVPSTTDASMLYATPDVSRRGSRDSAFDDAMDAEPTASLHQPFDYLAQPPDAASTYHPASSANSTTGTTGSATDSFRTARTAFDRRPSHVRSQSSDHSFSWNAPPARPPPASSSAATSTVRTASLSCYSRQAKAPSPPPAQPRSRSQSLSRPRASSSVRFSSPAEEPIPAPPTERATARAPGFAAAAPLAPRRAASHAVLSPQSSSSNLRSAPLSTQSSAARLGHLPGPAAEASASAAATGVQRQRSLLNLSWQASSIYTRGKPGTPIGVVHGGIGGWR